MAKVSRNIRPTSHLKLSIQVTVNGYIMDILADYIMMGVTHTLKLSPGKEAGQNQHPHRDGQQQHEGKRQCRCCCHDNPEKRQADQLDKSEQVHP